MAGLKEIADATGLSMNTVSRALRRSGYVSAETLRRVEEAAARLKYRPNRAARELRSSRSGTIAVVAESGDVLHIDKIAAIQETAAAAGYTVSSFFVNGRLPAGTLASVLELLRDNRPAGVIFIGMTGDFAAAAAALHREMPTTLISYSEAAEVSCVCIDRRGGVADAVRHLYRVGCRRIAFAGDDPMGNKLLGYRDAVRSLGLPEIIIPADDASRGADARRNAVRAAGAIAAMTPRPDGVQCSDYHAAALIGELAALGLRVPEDVAVSGFDNRDFSEIVRPTLTTLAQPNQEVGRAAAEMLLERIADPEAPLRSVCIPMRLILRESTGTGEV